MEQVYSPPSYRRERTTPMGGLRKKASMRFIPNLEDDSESRTTDDAGSSDYEIRSAHRRRVEESKKKSPYPKSPPRSPNETRAVNRIEESIKQTPSQGLRRKLSRNNLILSTNWAGLSSRTDVSDDKAIGMSIRSAASDGNLDLDSGIHRVNSRRPRRNSLSILQGAVDLKEKNNTIEKPQEESWTTDVDGRSVTFALMNSVTKPPKIRRSQRLPIRQRNQNVHKGSRKRRLGNRIQRWLAKQDIPTLTVLHLAAFLTINVTFAALWFLTDGGCCTDKGMTFAQTFDFAVQTSSTIGYGTYHPEGYFNNCLVVLLISAAVLLHTVYGGLLFFNFITPNANIHFSEVIAMSNVMGHACLEIRAGNADGDSNNLINAEANLAITSIQTYKAPNEKEERHTLETEELTLTVSRQHKFDGVWTLRHFIDENSPLFGMRFDEFPGNTIKTIELNIKAVHEITKGEVNSQATYQTQDIMVGWHFENQYSWNPESRTELFDYSKLSRVKPSMVWYPKGNADADHA